MDAIAIARDTPLTLLVAYILCTDLLTDARSIPSAGRVFSKHCSAGKAAAAATEGEELAAICERRGREQEVGIALTNWSEEREERARKRVHDCV